MLDADHRGFTEVHKLLLSSAALPYRPAPRQAPRRLPPILPRRHPMRAWTAPSTRSVSVRR